MFGPGSCKKWHPSKNSLDAQCSQKKEAILLSVYHLDWNVGEHKIPGDSQRRSHFSSVPAFDVCYKFYQNIKFLEIHIQRSDIECVHSWLVATCQKESKWWECSKTLVGEICSNDSKAGSNSDSELSSEAFCVFAARASRAIKWAKTLCASLLRGGLRYRRYLLRHRFPSEAMTLSGEEPKPLLQRFFSETKGKSVSSRFTCHLICEIIMTCDS